MIAQSRMIKRGAQARKKKKEQLKKSKTTGALGQNLPTFEQWSVLGGGPQPKKDPYALPKKDQPRIILSQDPIIRVMIEDSPDANYETLVKQNPRKIRSSRYISSAASSSAASAPPQFTTTSLSKEPQPQAQPQPPTRSTTAGTIESSLVGSSSTSSLSASSERGHRLGVLVLRQWLCYMGRLVPCVFSKRRRDNDGNKGIFSASASPSRDEFILGQKVTLPNGHTSFHGDGGEAASLSARTGRGLCPSFRSQGRVTSGCLWHACRAVTIGVLLIIFGITMAILGKKRMNARKKKRRRKRTLGQQRGTV